MTSTYQEWDPPRLHFPGIRLAARERARFLAVAAAICTDLIALSLASIGAALLRHGSMSSADTSFLLPTIWPAYFLSSVAYGSYSIGILVRRDRTIAYSALSLVTATGLALVTAFALHASTRFSRLETGYLICFGFVLLASSRVLILTGLTQFRSLIAPVTVLLGDNVATPPDSDADQYINVRLLNWKPIGEDPEFLDLVCRTLGDADRILLAFESHEERVAWASFMRLTGLNAELVEPQLKHIVPAGIGSWNGVPTLIISRGPLSLSERAIKRALDLFCAAIVGLLAVPLVAVLAIVIKLDSPGPCFFVQERVGRKNLRYRCYKLRTMRVHECDATGSRSTTRDDSRVTRLGRFLRRSSLDELPQLWNVLLGEMSFVGPRPHPLGATAEGAYFWQAVQTYWTRHAVKPGLTGLAQVRGFRGATHSLEDIQKRVQADLEYINSWSIWLDIRILLRTPFVLFHRNAF